MMNDDDCDYTCDGGEMQEDVTDTVWRCYDIERDNYWVRYVDNSLTVTFFESYDEMAAHISDAYDKGEYVPQRCDYREFNFFEKRSR
jgi:hypothetical protein